MSYIIAQLKTDLAGRLHGTSLKKVSGVDDLISRAARQLLLDCDPQETIRISPITLTEGVYDYEAPVDLKEDRIIDIRPQNNRESGDVFSQQYSVEFDRFKEDNKFQVRYNGGVKSLRISEKLAPDTPTDYDIEYYSNYLFRTADGETMGDWQETVTAEIIS